MLPTRCETLTRLLIVITPLLVIAAALVGQSAYLAQNKSRQTQLNLMLMTRVPASLRQLERQSEELKAIADNIENHSLSDIKALLDKTSQTARRASKEMQAQQNAWLKVQTQSKIDADSYRDIQANLSTVTSMQEQEIVRLNALIERATSKPVPITILAAIGSFLFGIASSILSSHLYEKLKEKAVTQDTSSR